MANAEVPEWVGSGYKHEQMVKFRFTPQSGYTIGLIFNSAYSCLRPGAVLTNNAIILYLAGM